MKVLILSPYTYSKPHFATTLEIIQSHLDKGDHVKLLGCTKSVDCCDYNLNHSFHWCYLCTSRQRRALKFLDKEIEYSDMINLSEKDLESLKSIKTSFSSTDEMKSYYFEYFDIGYAVLSGLSWKLREAEINLLKNAETIKKLMLNAARVFLSFRNHAKEFKPDVVYLFNGRLALIRGAFRYCVQNDIQCGIYDRGANKFKYNIWYNALPHNIAYTTKMINKYWANEEEKTREVIGSRFYQDRRNGVEQGWKSFTKNQNPDLLPNQWNSTENNIVIFNSSEDEFSSIGAEWERSLYENQVVGIKSIAESMKSDKSVRIYLRIHPNLIDVDNSFTRSLYDLGQMSNIEVISADSNISTYALIDAANTVLTFGSTVGVEATYWEKPSIVLGSSFYQNLHVAYKPESHYDLVSMLKSQGLEAKPKLGALKYGYYMNTFGHDYKYFVPNDFRHGKYDGNEFDPLPVRLAFKVYEHIFE